VRDIVIYPNRTACLDGKLLTYDETIKLMHDLGINDILIGGDLSFTRGELRIKIFTEPILKSLEQLNSSFIGLRNKYSSVATNLMLVHRQYSSLLVAVKELQRKRTQPRRRRVKRHAKTSRP
jgi:hypothetical protein